MKKDIVYSVKTPIQKIKLATQYVATQGFCLKGVY